MENTTVRLIVKFNINQGQLAAFKGMAAGIVDSVEAEEPLTTSYEWYINDSGDACYVSECYPNSDVLLAHLDHVGDALGALVEIAPLAEMLVFGSPSDAAMEVLSGFGAQVFPFEAGFVR